MHNDNSEGSHHILYINSQIGPLVIVLVCVSSPHSVFTSLMSVKMIRTCEEIKKKKDVSLILFEPTSSLVAGNRAPIS